MYIKFIAKNDTWFDIGTEVFDATVCDWGRKNTRIPEGDLHIWMKAGHILGRGLRDGDWDEELCPMEEFEILYTEEQIDEPSTIN